MTLKEQLNKLLEVFEEFISLQSFNQVYEMNSGMGILRDYSNGKLKLRFINDRGICDVLVSEPLNEENLEFYDLEAIRFLKLELSNKLSEKQLTRNQHYSSYEDLELIQCEYKFLVERFNPQKINETKKLLDKIKIRRSKTKYGT